MNNRERRVSSKSIFCNSFPRLHNSKRIQAGSAGRGLMSCATLISDREAALFSCSSFPSQTPHHHHQQHHVNLQRPLQLRQVRFRGAISTGYRRLLLQVLHKGRRIPLLPQRRHPSAGRIEVHERGKGGPAYRVPGQEHVERQADAAQVLRHVWQPRVERTPGQRDCVSTSGREEEDARGEAHRC